MRVGVLLLIACATPDAPGPLPCEEAGGWTYDKTGEVCCDGLVGINPWLVPGSPQLAGLPEGCTEDPAAPPDGSVCAPCGDGVCDDALGEDFCTCPADCAIQ